MQVPGTASGHSAAPEHHCCLIVNSIPGIQPKVFTIRPEQRSRCPGIHVHEGPEYAR